MDLLDDNGVDIAKVDESTLEAFTCALNQISAEALPAFLALAPANPTAADIGADFVAEFTARYRGTWPDRRSAALALASAPGGLLDGVDDLEAVAVYFDTEAFLADLSDVSRGTIVALGDGPVHVFAPSGRSEPFAHALPF